MKKLIFLLIYFCFLSIIFSKNLELNIKKNLFVDRLIQKRIKPLKTFKISENTEKDIFMSFITGSNIDKLINNDIQKYNSLIKKLKSKLERKSLGYAFKRSHRHMKCYQEISARIIDIKYTDLIKKFNIASNWGKNLSKYINGTIQVDKIDKKNRVVIQRERMIIKNHWLAFFAKDFDMEKYEFIEYNKNSTKVNWTVEYSKNRSVLVDDGYLLFRKIVVNKKEKTLVVFNSIHNVDTGKLTRILPKFIKDPLVSMTLKNTFIAHINRYKKIILKK